MNNNADTDFILEMSPSNWAPSVENYQFEIQVQDGALITGNVLADAVDAEDEVLYVSGLTQGENGSVVYNSDGTFTYTPEGGFLGSDQFTYQISDGTNVTTGSIDVVVNDNASVSINEGGAFRIDPGASLVDVDGSESLAVSLQGIPSGSLVTDGVNSVVLTSNSQSVDVSQWDMSAIVVTPQQNYSGNFTVSVSVPSSEQNGSTAQTIRALAVYVLPVADIPEADAMSLHLNNGASYIFSVRDFGFSDGDGDGLHSVRFSRLPDEGSLLLNGVAVTASQDVLAADISSLVYQSPVDSTSLEVSFDFTVNDGLLNSEESQFVITTGADDGVLTGTSGHDILLDDGSDSLITGGQGDDILTGGGGSDQFIWRASDVGASELPVNDIITDFSVGPDGDALDLSDLLAEPEPLDEYLAISFGNGNTVIEVMPEASSVTQRITLEGVDLSSYGGGSTDIEIINNLIDDGNLQV